MDVAYITALSALSGTVIGGLTSGFTSLHAERARARVEQLLRDRLRREELYKDFIVAASKVYADAAIHNEPSMADVVGLYALVNRMRVLSSPRVFACAEAATHAATDMYFSPNTSVRELFELVRTHHLDPLKEFSEAARDELQRDAVR